MMDSVKQDFKIEDEEKQEEQYEKDMKLQVAAKQDHQRWGYSTVERFEKIWTKIKEKNKETTIF